MGLLGVTGMRRDCFKKRGRLFWTQKFVHFIVADSNLKEINFIRANPDILLFDIRHKACADRHSLNTRV
jgi:hypothetical protein